MAETGKQLAKDSWKVATTFIGTIVGAGFASGQEIMKFFSHFGFEGIIGIIFSSLLFCLTGTLIMLLGHKLEAHSFGQVVRHVCGRKLGPLMDFLLTLFLFGTLSVMLAGSGAVFFQQWGLSFTLGTALTMIFAILIVLAGLRGIINANSIVVPFMVLICITATIPAITAKNLESVLSGFVPSARGAASCWIMSALLYVSYNITLSVSVLAPLGRAIKNRRALIWGGVLGGLGLGTLAMLINLAILRHYPDSSNYELPSLFVAGRKAWIIQLAFSFILWTEIFTTLIGNLYGLAARISDFTGMNYLLTAIILMALAFIMSQLGFSGLVGTLYPLFGYVSIIFLACLGFYSFLKHR